MSAPNKVTDLLLSIIAYFTYIIYPGVGCIDPVNGLCYSSDLGVTVGSCCTGSYCVAVADVTDRFCQKVVPAGGNCGNSTVSWRLLFSAYSNFKNFLRISVGSAWLAATVLIAFVLMELKQPQQPPLQLLLQLLLALPLQQPQLVCRQYSCSDQSNLILSSCLYCLRIHLFGSWNWIWRNLLQWSWRLQCFWSCWN